ncbi:MAG: hypothetical protein COA79_06620 [Planctomycetota bacterium]|nr:MAG: hypothetical protein COA79_06620 [Planctomycetota bacterium]
MSDLPRELGDFILQELIGTGGMGEVYRGVQKSLDRDVAVKLLRDEYARDENFIVRFKREAKSAAKLIHPNIIQVYQLGEENGEYYFAMEFVKGDDLQQILQQRNGKLPLPEVLKIIYGVAKALEIAFKHSIVHRDIKPSNVLITVDDDIKVMDFGLAKAFEGGQTDITISGAIMGTANYMSPEQAEGKDVDQRTDLYSMGVMFYQLLTGYLPFTGDNPTSLAFQHVHSAPTPPMEKIEGISNRLNDICLKCLNKKKDDRYQNATEFLRDLQVMMDDSSSHYDFTDHSITKSEAKTVPTMQETMVASNEATVDSTIMASNNNETLAPGMMDPTRMDAPPTVMGESIANTVVHTGSTQVKMQELNSESTKLDKSQSSKKGSGGLVLAVIAIVLIGGGLYAAKDFLGFKGKDKPITGSNGKANSNNSSGKNNNSNASKNGTSTVAIDSNMVDVSLKILKSKLAKGFKVRLAENLDNSGATDKIALDDIELLPSLAGDKKLELSHDYYKTLIINVSVSEDGKIDLTNFSNPKVNLDKLVNQIGSYFVSSRKDQLKQLLAYGFSEKQTNLIKDRIRIITIEVEASKLFKNPTQENLVRSHNLLGVEKRLTIDGKKLFLAIKSTASKDKKLVIVDGTLKIVRETTIKNSLGMMFEIIEPGEFMMGSSTDQKYTKKKVVISKRFAILKFEVSNNAYRKLYETLDKLSGKTGRKVHNSSSYLNKDLNGGNQPVVNVSWERAKEFCDNLTKLEKATGRVYRLPTEAEWEYCAKGGQDIEFSWGLKDSDYKGQANVLDAGSTADIAVTYKRFKGNDKFIVSAPVGRFKPNSFNLYDFGGNVREWVNDNYVSGGNIKDGDVDPKGPSDTGEKCVRGASYLSGVKKGRITYRRGKHEESNLYDIGFRVVLEMKNK